MIRSYDDGKQLALALVAVLYSPCNLDNIRSARGRYSKGHAHHALGLLIGAKENGPAYADPHDARDNSGEERAGALLPVHIHQQATHAPSVLSREIRMSAGRSGEGSKDKGQR